MDPKLMKLRIFLNHMDIYFCEYGMIKVKKLNHIAKKVGMWK